MGRYSGSQPGSFVVNRAENSSIQAEWPTIRSTLRLAGQCNHVESTPGANRELGRGEASLQLQSYVFRAIEISIEGSNDVCHSLNQ
jgi:hypothetical protein